MLIDNYIGLPINKYLTVGSFAISTMENGLAVASKLGGKIEVLCKLSDIQVETTPIRHGVVTFTYGSRVIICNLADEYPSLIMFLENYDLTTIELIYILEYGKMLFYSNSWYSNISIFHKIKSYVRMNPTLLDLVKTYEKELITVRKSRIKPNMNIKKRHITKDMILDIMGGKYKSCGFLDTFEKRKIFNLLSIEEKLECIEDLCYIKALEGAVCPQIFNKGPRVGIRAAHKWALMRLCTKDLPIYIRRFVIDHVKSIASEYTKQYVTDFIKNYRKYTNDKESEEQLNVPTTIHESGSN